ncbi:MAG: hypothetical protein JWO25_3267 [Alphaproteobacteria bacterium]|nr:hypothetical protein [Alphaproteobacteria bacterium]
MSTKPFRAFVSYCHSDLKFAAALQKRLETYRLPRRLAAQVEPMPGVARGRIGPVFRDVADLSATESLSAAVCEAITSSSALVVVGSPDAATSRWVEREVRLYRELHPDGRILVALARGELAEALPPALAGGEEPLAADFRRGGEGRRLAFLKIVAGLTGLPLDALVQRDSQRRLRSVMAVTLGAFVLVIAMAGLLIAALRAQAEAQRRRADAEGLVEFMLKDLRQELKGVGDMNVMSTVNSKALGYYASQGDLARLPDDSLDRRARVLQSIAEDEINRGRLERASRAVVEANRTTSVILARRPRDPDAIFTHAQSEFYTGQLARLRKDRAGAARHWQAYRRQARALAAVESGSVRSLMEQGYAEGDLCDLYLTDDRDPTKAEQACLAAIAHVQSAAARDPANRQTVQDLANRYGWIAKVRVAQGRDREALASRRAEMALMDRLVDLAPDNIEFALRRAWPDIAAADILIRNGEPNAALSVLHASLARHGRLFGLHSEDQRVPQTRLKTYLLEARALRAAGRDYRDALVAADAQQQSLAGLGKQAKAVGEAIRASLWLGTGR